MKSCFANSWRDAAACAGTIWRARRRGAQLRLAAVRQSRSHLRVHYHAGRATRPTRLSAAAPTIFILIPKRRRILFQQHALSGRLVARFRHRSAEVHDGGDLWRPRYGSAFGQFCSRPRRRQTYVPCFIYRYRRNLSELAEVATRADLLRRFAQPARHSHLPARLHRASEAPPPAAAPQKDGKNALFPPAGPGARAPRMGRNYPIAGKAAEERRNAYFLLRGLRNSGTVRGSCFRVLN